MRPASVNYLQEEALLRGARPRVRGLIYPFDLDLGLYATGLGDGWFEGDWFVDGWFGDEGTARSSTRSTAARPGSWLWWRVIIPPGPGVAHHGRVHGQPGDPHLAGPGGYMEVTVALRSAPTYAGVAAAAWVNLTSGGSMTWAVLPAQGGAHGDHPGLGFG